MKSDTVMSGNWAVQILETLDSHAEDMNFPTFENNNFSAVDMRLTVFRSDKEWLLAFEVIAFANSQNLFVNLIYGYGNHLFEQGMRLAHEISLLDNLSIFEDTEGSFVNRFSFVSSVDGKVKDFVFYRDDYEIAGVDLTCGDTIELSLLKLLAFVTPNDLFLSGDALIKALVEEEITEFIKLEDWHHPDILNDELPSQNECFKSIAEALMHNKKKLYFCDPDKVNTHWSLWEY
ncbi:hypothetical protein [Moorena sp. SIO3A5]|uniref:DUF7003 family protein n=1 Tax=Moorena sp. SIO3A5 TaxID=2607822 RepID=UPI00141D1FA5|nr:hypothetical protein [Moorena sp. SIO3A5]NEP68636.1 hypothetical protein [Moorena sp. SIO3A5]